MHPILNHEELLRYYEQTRQSPPPSAADLGLMTGFPPPEHRLVTLENWMAPPFNRWAFANVAQLLPGMCIPAGATPHAMNSPTGAVDELAFDSVCGRRTTLAEHLTASYTDAFLVMQGDTVHYERYWNGHQPCSTHLMYSCAKSFFGLLAEILIDEGVLDEDQHCGRYVPELARSAFADATLRQVLDMAVSIKYDEVYENPKSNIYDYAIAIGWQPPHADHPGWPSVYRYLPELTKRKDHGDFFHYITPVTEVLGWIIERVTGRSCAVWLHERLWSRLSPEYDAYLALDPWGKTIVAGGLCAALRDLGRFGQLMAGQGSLHGERIVEARVIEKILAGGNRGFFGCLPEFEEWLPGGSYRSQWFVVPGDIMLASGVYGQYVYCDPGTGVVIVKQSSLPFKVTTIDNDTIRLFKAISRSLAGQ